LIDPACLRTGKVPTELAGSLNMPKAERQTLAISERLVLTWPDTGEPYRMILDPSSGRFVARRL